MPFEVMLAVYLDARQNVAGSDLMSDFTPHSLLGRYRHIFAAALSVGTRSLLLVHNHPSGRAKPSEADIRMTSYLEALALPLEIEVEDHLIVGGSDMFSMRHAGLCGGHRS